MNHSPESSTPDGTLRQSALPVLVLCCFWGLLIYQLGAQWSAYDQYNYGWSVPLVCLYLLWRRAQFPATASAIHPTRLYLPIALLALLYAPTRLLHEANPIWRLTSLLWALEVVGFTFCFIYVAGGWTRLRQYAFPIAFFLVAVPWPSGLEALVVQSLMRLNTWITVELLGWIGVPAIQHGNVIEISNGMVGIEEACSGIRSAQATLMISLFLGEVFRLLVRWRILLVFGGFVLAFGFNVVRTFLLTWVAATKGMAALASWHDPAGVTILLACFICLWLAAWALRGPKLTAEAPRSDGICNGPILRNLAMALGCWFVLVEAGTEFWFRAHERPNGAFVKWSPNWPRQNPSFEEVALPPDVQGILQFDQSSSGRWRQRDGTRWQVFYFRWLPARSVYGRVKVAFAKRHNPEVCLRGAGIKMVRELDSVTLDTGHGFSMGFRRYVYDEEGRIVYVFFSVEEDMETSGSPGFLRMTHRSRLQAALAGSRNYGERSLEIAASGFEKNADVTAELAKELPGLIMTGN